MIYTSYFGKMKSLPENVIPITICVKAPDWYKGKQYKQLAPKYDFLMEWKRTHDNEHYIKCFKEQVTDKLLAADVVNELFRLVGKTPYDGTNICLLCYEKPTDFCHRHLVAEWLTSNGYKCEEWN